MRGTLNGGRGLRKGRTVIWKKIYEVQNGHQTGRWQWKFPGNRYYREALYPGIWLFGDAICPPPGCGRASETRKRGDDVHKFLGPIGPEEDDDEDSGSGYA